MEKDKKGYQEFKFRCHYCRHKFTQKLYLGTDGQWVGDQNIKCPKCKNGLSTKTALDE